MIYPRRKKITSESKEDYFDYAIIYFEGIAQCRIDYDELKIKKRGHYFFLNKKLKAFIPLNYQIAL
ncbi:hypothetical protein PHG11b_42 [Flavobacterium phage 11b]|uniref:hypothetical protein n=1 Tax=Flavobacterium phage 11b TaxID=294631 RepID=UPI0000444148|nr:hypothetical protein PHG11b_42 [Flavobacterium phage 11b]CAH56669.1 hypothetical protein PHG11b_42 [Flavobacterium phage 11b]